jgi:hypothetical protein
MTTLVWMIRIGVNLKLCHCQEQRILEERQNRPSFSAFLKFCPNLSQLPQCVNPNCMIFRRHCQFTERLTD